MMKTPNNTLIGIVILNYKTYRETIRLVEDLLSFTSSSFFKIVVVDNDSPNESLAELRLSLSEYENVDIIASGENGGYAKGNNVGLHALEKYSPKYALVLNNDVYFDESTLLKSIERYESLPNPGAVSPVQYLPDNTMAYLGSLRCNRFIDDILSYSLLAGKIRKKTNYVENSDIPNVRLIDIVPGCFVLIDFALFKSIGFYDEDTFLFCEERFLFKKLEKVHVQSYYLLDLKYVHDHSFTINSEYARINQRKLLNNGHISFTKKYRKNKVLKSWALKMALVLYSFREKVLSFCGK